MEQTKYHWESKTSINYTNHLRLSFNLMYKASHLIY